MRDIWVTSDLHLGHANILTFKNEDGSRVRDFEDVETMDQTILENFNSKVKPGDILYCLGDMFFGSKDNFKTLWPKFNGSKRLIVGNHDDVKFLSTGGFFKKVELWRVWSDHRLLFTHVPVHETTLEKRGPGNLVNVHGHTHSNGSPDGPYLSVCVEMRDYMPVHIEDLVAESIKVRN